MKTIFITGASSGLGKATAKLFQSKGWRVIATMRHPEKETELGTLENVTLLPLDVTNPETIDEAVAKATAISDINVVFNNAGYGLLGPIEACTDEQIVRQINTNLLGVIRVTKAFIPHFREKKSGLFLTTTSIGGMVSFPFSPIYHATKFGLEGWTASMSYELGLFGIGIKTIAPGGIRTDFGGRSIDVKTQPEYQEAFDKFMTIFDEGGYDDAETVAQVVYEAATDGKSQLRYVVGQTANYMYNRSLEMDRDAFVKELGDSILYK